LGDLHGFNQGAYFGGQIAEAGQLATTEGRSYRLLHGSQSLLGTEEGVATGLAAKFHGHTVAPDDLTVFEDQANREGFGHLAYPTEARRDWLGGVSFGGRERMAMKGRQIIEIVCPRDGDSQHITDSCYDACDSLCSSDLAST
jgi:hypothetical protein